MAKIETHLSKAIEYHQSGNLPQALTMYDAILKSAPRNPAALYFKGMALHQLGQTMQSLPLLQKASSLDPNNPDVWNLLGVVQRALGNLDAAEHALNHAVSLAPGSIEALGNLGCVCQDKGKYVQALTCFEKVLKKAPRSVDALMMAGSALQEQGRHADAERFFKQALEIEPRRAELHYNYGVLFHAMGKPNKAYMAFWSALRLAPDSAEFVLGNIENARGDNNRALTFHILGSALLEGERYDEACLAFEKALALQPESAETHDRMGVAQMNLGYLEVARQCFDRAITINSHLAAAWNDMGTLHVTLGEYDKARLAFNRAIKEKPDYAEVYHNLALLYEREGSFDKSTELLEKAIEIEPGYALAHNNYAITLLRHGDWQHAWREFEWRIAKKTASVVKEPFYIYHPDESGTVLPLPSSLLPIDLKDKRILVMRDQGIGDELFFLRFVRVLKEKGAHITYETSHKLLDVLKDIDFIDSLYEGYPKGLDFDHILLITDVPVLTDMKSDKDVPPPVPLCSDNKRKEQIEVHLRSIAPGPYVGVTWRAGTRGGVYNNRNLYKEIPLELFASKLREWPGTVVVVQRHPDTGEIEKLQELLESKVIDMSAMNEDLPGMLALLDVLDEYLGVSNTNMHLRASLGKTAQVLVPWPPEWRWGLSGASSIWFPGFKVIREDKTSHWDKVLPGLKLEPTESKIN